MTKYSALLDACVLVPISLADTLLRLAEVGLYRPLWSERILDEVTAAIESVHPDLKSDGKARARAFAMDAAFEDASVTGWEDLISGITLPDPNDRHVVAAALRGRADVIVTNNVKDFPRSQLDALGMSVQTADEFLLNQLDLDPTLVMEALENQARATSNPRLKVAEIVARLDNCQAHLFAKTARGQLWRIASELR